VRCCVFASKTCATKLSGLGARYLFNLFLSVSAGLIFFSPGHAAAPSGVKAPTITPNGGSFGGSVSVSLATDTGGATIYYTTDGSSPTESSLKYSGPITIATDALLKAKAFKKNFDPSAEASAWFSKISNFDFTLANSGNVSAVAGSSVANTINATLASGNTQSVSLTVSGLPSGATGTFSAAACSPTCSSTLTISTSAATPTGTSTITVSASGSSVTKSTTFSLTVSAPVTATVATPIITPNGGTFISSVSVTIATVTSGASIYYTTDGSAPTQSSLLYSGAMALTKSATLRAKAFKSGYNPSAEASATFQSDLVAYWKFDEGTGTTAADSSGNGNTGTLVNGPQWVSGISGKALYFDGVAANVAVLDSPSLNPSSAFTLSTWVNPATTFTDFRSILVKNYAYYLYSSVGGYCSDGSPLGGFSDTANETVCQSAPLPINIWTHLALTYDGSALTFYRNGIAVGAAIASGTLPSTTGALQIAASQFGEHFNGLIDEVRVYSRALSPTEIQAVYQQFTTFNYAISNSGDRSVIAGFPTTNTISTTLASGASQPVSFSVSGLPAGASASFSVASCSPSCSSTLTINTSAATPAGNSTITVTGTGGGVTSSTTFTLTVSTTTLTVATPTITPNGGSFTSSVSVSLATTTSGASIYYTTDGSAPTQSSTLYTGAITLTKSITLRAKAFLSGYNPSSEGSATFSAALFGFSLSNSGNTSITAGSSATNTIGAMLLSGTSQAVSFSVFALPSGASGSFSSSSCSPSCSTVLTINTSGSTPAGNYSVTVNATGGGITSSTAFSLTVAASTVATPTITPNGGTFGSSVSVTMSTATAGASIYYTTDGSTPTQSSPLYNGAMTLTTSAVVTAKAFKSGYNPSGVVTASFTKTSTGTTYYVATNGSDSNSGTLSSPFRTVQKCANVAQPGDTCLIRSGTYGTLRPARSGATGNPITFKNYPGELAVLNYSVDPNSPPNPDVFVIDLSYLQWIVIDGLKTTGGTGGIMMYSNSSNHQILNCEVTGALGTGITVWGGGNNNLIHNCKVYDNVKLNWPRGAIYSRGGTWGAGITVQSGGSNNVVEDCYIYWNHGEGLSTGIGTTNSIFRRNVVADNWSVNLYVDGANNTTFDSNLVYLTNEAKNWPTVDPQGRNKSNALGIGAAVEPDSSFVAALSGLKIVNNIVVNANSGIWAWPEQAGHTFSNWLIANNTLIRNGDGIKLINSGAGISGMTINSNIIVEDASNAYSQMQLEPIPTASAFNNNIFYGINAYYINYDLGGGLYNYSQAAGQLGFTNSIFGVDPALYDKTYIPPRFWSDPSLPPPSAIVPLDTLVSSYDSLPGSPSASMGAGALP
jgi:hypothetical protein